MASSQAEALYTTKREQLPKNVSVFVEPRTPSIPIPPPQRVERFVRLALERVSGASMDPWLTADPWLKAQRCSDTSSLPWTSPGDDVAINPQPLPPRYLFLTALAQEVINNAELMLEITLASEGTERAIIVIGGYIDGFVDDTCGNGFRLIWRGPGPRPNWFPERLTGLDLLVMGQQFAQSAHNQFDAGMGQVMSGAAAKLTQAGSSRLRTQ